MRKWISILLLLLPAKAIAEDTVLHGMQGAALHMALAKYVFHTDKQGTWIAGMTGFAFGVLPDIPYNEGRFHTLSNDSKFYLYVPAYGLHLLIDIPFHKQIFQNKWGKDGWLVLADVVLWVATVYLLKLIIE